MPPPHKPADEVAAYPEEQLRGWMAQYGPALRRYFLKKVGPNEADDLVQDVFLSLQVRGQAASIDNVERYLFRIAANAVVRRKERQTWDWAGHDELDDGALPDEVSPERVLIGKQAVEHLVAALHDLPARSSEAFFLHRFEEMTYAAIAQRMNISTKAVDHLIQRALKRIAAALDHTR